MGAPHSSTPFRHSSTVRDSLIVDLYSRMRPQPVHVRLQACSGSSIITSGYFFSPLSPCLTRDAAMLAVKPSETLIHLPPQIDWDALSHRRKSARQRIF